MAQTSAIIDELKQVLKQAGLTYRQVAAKLDISEASVKRMFSLKQLSLARLDQICELAEVEISDLVQRLNKQDRLLQLSVEQEQLLVSDIKLLIVAVCAVNRWSYGDIFSAYQFMPAELTKKLTQLDRIGLIELLPKNRIKPLIHHDFTWQQNGPIQRFFESHVQSDFFNCHFDGPGELRLFSTGMLSRHNNHLMRQKIQRLARDFRQYHQEDLALPLTERFGMGLVLAIRPWEFEVFETQRRDPEDKRYRD